jgi:hypothetical protein
MPETLLSPSNMLLFGRLITDLSIIAPNFPPPPANSPNPSHAPFPLARAGGNRDVESQLTAANANFARIYGFSYEGTYYDLPRPVLFLVHGPGVLASQSRAGGPGNVNPARAPSRASLTGVAAADFALADDLMVWSYDKADYTIRMDVDTGMFEDLLLGTILGGGGPGASGARVSGARVSGARVSGARVSGARLSGGRGDAGD